jgi:endonuclease/exonuclease/phosphatase family metal-dependent hydrolase
MALSLVSINVEWDKHHDTVLPFLERTDADIVCIQELPEKDIALYEKAYGGTCIAYAPVCRLQRPEGLMTITEAILTRIPAQGEVLYYAGSREAVRVDDENSDVGVHALILADLQKDGVPYTIATTHFTWSPKGEANDDQRRDQAALFAILDSLGEFAFAGDFNAPRGKETFSKFAERYQDNIPPHYETSIDVTLHKTRNNPVENARVGKYMVDGLFTTPQYQASNVRLEFGISDHAAIIATIEKTAP